MTSFEGWHFPRGEKRPFRIWFDGRAFRNHEASNEELRRLRGGDFILEEKREVQIEESKELRRLKSLNLGFLSCQHCGQKGRFDRFREEENSLIFRCTVCGEANLISKDSLPKLAAVRDIGDEKPKISFEEAIFKRMGGTHVGVEEIQGYVPGKVGARLSFKELSDEFSAAMDARNSRKFDFVKTP